MPLWSAHFQRHVGPGFSPGIRLGTLCAVLACAESGVLAQRLLPIHDIQGSGARSPFEGQLVATRGIVTGRKSNGFFIQSPDGGDDGNAATSEGVFVFTGVAPAANLTAGAVVAVRGRVLEFVPAADPLSPPLTEIAESPTVEVRGAGAPLPVPLEITSAVLSASGGHEQLEALEGMRVRVATLVLTAPTLGSVTESSATASSNGVFYGVLPDTARPFREPGIDVRTPLPGGAPCCLPRFDGNPERLRVDSDGQPGAATLDLPTGTVLANVVGLLDYGFQSYTLLPDPTAPPAVVSLPLISSRLRPPNADELSVASINLQRLFDTSDDRSVTDAVLTQAAFQNRLQKISLYLRQSLQQPDVVGVQEVENLATLQALATMINRDVSAAGSVGPGYEAYLEEGNDPGGIDVGVLVKRSRLEVLDSRQEGRSEPFRSSPTAPLELLNDRPPLLVTVRSVDPLPGGATVTVIVNHLRSLIDIDDGASGGRVRAKRAAQAEYLARLVARQLAASPSARLVVMGDLNAFEFSDGYVDVLGTLRGAPASRDQVVLPTSDLLDPDLSNLASLLPPEQRYSYVFDGTAQVLDHMLVTDSLRAQLTMFAYVRGNADAPEVWRTDPRRPERISDHDGALAYFTLGQ